MIKSLFEAMFEPTHYNLFYFLLTLSTSYPTKYILQQFQRLPLFPLLRKRDKLIFAKNTSNSYETDQRICISSV